MPIQVENRDFYTITTLVPCCNTGILAALNEVYSDFDRNDLSSSLLYKSQYNLRNLLSISNGSMVNTSIIDSNNVSSNIPPNGHQKDFGKQYSQKPGIVYSVKFASRSNIWNQDTLAERIHNLKIFETNFIKSKNVFDTQDIQYRNTIVLKNEFI